MAAFYYATLLSKWVFILFYVWKVANMFTLYTCHLMKLQKNMLLGVLAIYMGFFLALYITTVIRDMLVPPPQLLAVIERIDSFSRMIDKAH